MKKVSSTIEAKVREMFSPQEAETVLSAFAEMQEPPSEGEWATTRARVQAAILISAQSELEKLLRVFVNPCGRLDAPNVRQSA